MTTSTDNEAGRSVMDRLLHSAVDQLREVPAYLVKVDEVADRAGIPRSEARAIFPEDAVLNESVAGYAMVQLADALTRALIAAPPGDNRAALIAISQAYVDWARGNRALYGAIATRLLQPSNADSIVRRYDASFAPLIRRFLGEDGPDTTTRRAAIARATLFGLTDLILERRENIWLLPNPDFNAEISATIVEFVDILIASLPARD